MPITYFYESIFILTTCSESQGKFHLIRNHSIKIKEIRANLIFLSPLPLPTYCVHRGPIKNVRLIRRERYLPMILTLGFYWHLKKEKLKFVLKCFLFMSLALFGNKSGSRFEKKKKKKENHWTYEISKIDTDYMMRIFRSKSRCFNV